MKVWFLWSFELLSVVDSHVHAVEYGDEPDAGEFLHAGFSVSLSNLNLCPWNGSADRPHAEYLEFNETNFESFLRRSSVVVVLFYTSDSDAEKTSDMDAALLEQASMLRPESNAVLGNMMCFTPCSQLSCWSN